MNPYLYDLEQVKLAFLHEPNPSLETRRDRIGRLLTMLNENEENIFKAIQADFGHRNAVETRISELVMIREAARFTLKNLGKWIKKVPVKTPFQFKPSKSYLLPQAKGVVGIMSPWNYPLSLALAPTIAAIAAGNRVWLKPSERSARTSGYLATLIAQYFHPTEITIINGGPEVASHFSKLPFDHLLFTGSSATGTLVAKAAAENLTPLTLELGGKSPTVLDANINMKDTAERILYGKLFNAGQTCIAPDYLLVPHQKMESFVEEAKNAFEKMYLDGSSLTTAIDQSQLARWKDLLEDASQNSAGIVPLSSSQLQYPIIPSLIIQPNSKSKVMNEEIFGPFLPVIGYESIDEVIEFINAFPTPLALYWFGSQGNRLKKVLELTRAGGVTINDTLLHSANPYLPFGGVGQSGYGSYHGKYSFDMFTHYKPIFETKGFLGINARSGTKFAHPPYGKTIEKLLRILEKK